MTQTVLHLIKHRDGTRWGYLRNYGARGVVLNWLPSKNGAQFFETWHEAYLEIECRHLQDDATVEAEVIV
jgi:hypothetical protein